MRLLRMTVMALLTVAALAACGSDDDATVRSGDDQLPSGDGAPTCAEMFREGRPTEEVVADYDRSPCTTDGEVVVSLVATQECADGTTLSFNELGWGYSEGTWHEPDPGPEASNPPSDELYACMG